MVWPTQKTPSRFEQYAGKATETQPTDHPHNCLDTTNMTPPRYDQDTANTLHQHRNSWGTTKATPSYQRGTTWTPWRHHWGTIKRAQRHADTFQTPPKDYQDITETPPIHHQNTTETPRRHQDCQGACQPWFPSGHHQDITKTSPRHQLHKHHQDTTETPSNY